MNVDPDFTQKRLYKLLNYKYRERYQQIGGHEALRSLRDEVAIAKLTLEETINSIHNESEFKASRADIAHQLVTIEKLVASMTKLETSVGQLLSKPTILKIASDIIQILIDKLKDVPDHELIIDEVSKAILQSIDNVKENKE
jgi:hypothetical protein